MTSSNATPEGSLLEQEARQALDQIADGFVTYDSDWRVLYLNRAAEKYFGVPREEMLGRVIWDVFPSAVGSEAERKLRGAIERHEATEFEALAPAMQRWVAFRVFPSERGVSISFRDVTARKEAEDALRTSEAKHRAIFEHALDAMFWTAPNGEIHAANQAACRMFGMTEAEICAVGRAGTVDESDPRFAAALDERRRTGELRAELTAMRKDGSRFPVEVSSAVYTDAEGRQRTSLVLRDLTEKKRAEDRLRVVAEAGMVIGSTLDSEATLRELTRLVVPRLGDYCIVDLLRAGELRRVAVSHRDRSREAQLMAVGSAGPVLWKEAGLYKVARTGEPELVPIVDDAWLRATTRDEAHLAIARSNTPRSVVIVPLVGRNGVIGVLSVVSVDDHRRLDGSDLATAQAIADRAAIAIENARLYEQAVQAKRLRDEVLAVVSHDLRNPLNAILLNARLLARRTEAEEVAGIERAARRADSLIQDLLTVAALEGNATRLERARHSLASILEEALELHRPMAANRRIELEGNVAADGGHVSVDRHRLLQALGNLIGNSLKFTDAGGRVRVEARRVGSSVVITVSDTGSGIAPEELPHVFDRFWQGARSRRGGAGLGLAIAKGIVEAHGGRLTVESVLGRGTTFTIGIPLDESAEPAGRTSSPTASELHHS